MGDCHCGRIGGGGAPRHRGVGFRGRALWCYRRWFRKEEEKERERGCGLRLNDIGYCNNRFKEYNFLTNYFI